MTGTDFGLSNRIALVTGSSAGIGNAFAQALAAAGATVVINGRDRARLEAAVDRMRADGAPVHGEVFDVADRDSVARAVSSIEASIGPIDILVNNAGIARRRPFLEMSDDDWDVVLEVNLTSAFHVSRNVVPSMIDRGGGRIVNTCSLMSSIARRDNANYAAAKGGLAMLTKELAVELGEHGITVNGIAPGYIDTPLAAPLIGDPDFNAWIVGRTPMRRWGNVDDLCGAVVFLASDAARFVTGQILYVDGGFTASM